MLIPCPRATCGGVVGQCSESYQSFGVKVRSKRSDGRDQDVRSKVPLSTVNQQRVFKKWLYNITV